MEAFVNVTLDLVIYGYMKFPPKISFRSSNTQITCSQTASTPQPFRKSTAPPTRFFAVTAQTA